MNSVIRRLSAGDKIYTNFKLYPRKTWWVDIEDCEGFRKGNYRLHKNGKRCLANRILPAMFSDLSLRLEFDDYKEAIAWISLPWEKAYKLYLRTKPKKSCNPRIRLLR